MMIILRQHIPAFCDGVEPKMATAATVEELLAVPWVAAYARDQLVGTSDGKEPLMRKFYRFSMKDGLLMAEHSRGRYWWVVGRLRSDEPIALPRWVPVE